MKDGFFSKISSGGQLSIFFILMLTSLLFFTILGYVIGVVELEVSPSYFNSAEGIFKMKLSQILQAIGLFIVPSIIAAYLFKNKGQNYLQIRKAPWILFVLSALLMLFALPLINWLGAINNQLHLPSFLASTEAWMHSKETSAGQLMEHFLKAPDLSSLALNLLVMAVIPAIGEELLFRGVIQKLMIKMSKNAHIGIWLTAFLFSAVHMQFFTFMPRFFLGAALGYLLVWSGSIWLPILAHFINNALAVVLHYLIEHNTINSNIDTIGSKEHWTFPLTSLILTSLVLFLIHKNAKKQKSPIME
jgi:hypothetical protein